MLRSLVHGNAAPREGVALPLFPHPSIHLHLRTLAYFYNSQPISNQGTSRTRLSRKEINDTITAPATNPRSQYLSQGGSICPWRWQSSIIKGTRSTPSRALFYVDDAAHLTGELSTTHGDNNDGHTSSDVGDGKGA